MRPDEDPPRLMDELASDAQLREALRVVSRDVPTSDQLAKLVDGVASASAAGGVAVVGKVWMLKAAMTAVLAGVIGTAVWFWPRGEQAEHEASTARVERTGEVSPVHEAAGGRVAHGTAVAPHDAGGPVARAGQEPAAAMQVAKDVEHADTARTSVPEQAAAKALAARSSAKRPRNLVTTSAPQAPARTTRQEQPAPDENETTLIAGAQQALIGEPRRALTLLERHRDLYPRGEFAEERDVLTLDALARLQLRAALFSNGREFLEKYPNSVHTARVQKLLGTGGD